MASKHRDIGLKFRHRSTPNTRRVTKNVGLGGGGGVPYICMYIIFRDYIGITFPHVPLTPSKHSLRTITATDQVMVAVVP